MALSDILNKIIADAEKEAKELLKKAEAEVRDIARATEQKTAELHQKSAEDTVERKKVMERKISAHLQMQEKTELAAMKSELLADVQQRALQKLCALPEKEQLQILEKLLRKVPEKGTLHPAKGQKVLVEKAAQVVGKSWQIGTEADIQGGFLFEGEDIDLNASYEELLAKEIFGQHETEISPMLFT